MGAARAKSRRGDEENAREREGERVRERVRERERERGSISIRGPVCPPGVAATEERDCLFNPVTTRREDSNLCVYFGFRRVPRRVASSPGEEGGGMAAAYNN